MEQTHDFYHEHQIVATNQREEISFVSSQCKYENHENSFDKA